MTAHPAHRVTSSANLDSPYKHRLMPVFWLLSAFLCIVFVVDVLKGMSALQALIVVVLTLALLTIVMWALFRVYEFLVPVRIEPAGVRTYNCFGGKADVAWKDVRRVQRLVVFPGVEWLLLIDHRTVFNCPCLPLFVTEKARLRQAVHQWAGEDSFVSQALANSKF